MINERIEMNKKKAEFFMKEKLKVHIELLDGWLNGFFIKKLEDDIFIFIDDVIGERHIFLSEIRDIANWRPPKTINGEKDKRPKYNNF